MHFVLTGPESSGKTTLTIQLSKLLKQNYLPEYARFYLTYEKPGAYDQSDILFISDQTYRLQRSKNLPEHYLMDTAYLVQKVWSEVKYGEADKAIERRFIEDDAYYLLCSPDIVWEDDPLRENPYDRERIFGLYEDHLKSYEKPYSIISGSPEERLNLSLQLLDQIKNTL